MAQYKLMVSQLSSSCLHSVTCICVKWCLYVLGLVDVRKTHFIISLASFLVRAVGPHRMLFPPSCSMHAVPVYLNTCPSWQGYDSL